MDEEEQQDTPGAAVDESQDDSFDEWALEMEGEYQSPEDDAELSFEDSTVAGTTPGAVRVSCAQLLDPDTTHNLSMQHCSFACDGCCVAVMLVACILCLRKKRWETE